MSIEEIIKELIELAELYDTRDKEGDGNICMKAIEAIRQLKSRAEKAEKDLKAARNELCYKCGRYHEAHNGVCDGCKWKETNK